MRATLPGSLSCPVLPKGGPHAVPSSTAPASAGDASLGSGVDSTGLLALHSGPTNGRGRSGSPSSGRALAGDLRRIFRNRDSPGASDSSLIATPPPHRIGNTSTMSTATSIEPLGQGAISAQSMLSVARTAVQQQVAPWVNRFESSIGQMEAKSDANAHRLSRLEKKVAAQLEELRTTQPRDRDGGAAGSGVVAEVKGSVNGLMDEVGVLTKRVDGLDERLWKTTSGSEASNQRSRELQQQVQLLEQQGRQSQVNVEEVQRRQVAKLRRTELSVEELSRRLAAVEEELRAHHGGRHRDNFALEARMASLEQAQARADDHVRSFQTHVEGEFNDVRTEQSHHKHALALGGVASGGDLESMTSRIIDQGLVAVERRVAGQLEDLATSLANVKVKVDGQAQRSNALAERLETAHEPALETMRLELMQARSQDWSRVENEIAQLRGSLRAAAEEVAAEEAEAAAAAREALRQANVDMAAHLRELDNRVGNEMGSLRVHLEALCGSAPELPPEPPQPSGAQQQDGSANGTASSAAIVEHMGTERDQHTTLSEQFDILARQVQQLHGNGEELWRTVQDMDAKLAQISEDTSSIMAALPQVDHDGAAPHLSLSTSGIALDASSSVLGRHPQRSVVATHGAGNEESDSRGSGSGPDMNWEGEAENEEADAETTFQQQTDIRRLQELDAVSERLQATDVLAERVASLQRHMGVTSGGSSSSSPCGQALESSQQHNQAHASARPANLQCLAHEVSEIQARLLASQLRLQDLGAMTSGGFHDRDDEGATPREDEIVALAERIYEAERDLPDSFAQSQQPRSGGLEDFAPAALSCPDPRFAEVGATAGEACSIGATGVAIGAADVGAHRQDSVATATPPLPSSTTDCGDMGDGYQAFSAIEDAQGFSEISPLSFFANQLGNLEGVLRGFADRLDVIQAAEASNNAGEQRRDAALQAWAAEIENLKEHVAMSLDGLTAQGRELDDAKINMDRLWARMSSLDADVAHTRQLVDMANSGCQVYGQRLQTYPEATF